MFDLTSLVKNVDYGLLLPSLGRLPHGLAGLLTNWRGDITFLLRSEARRSGIRNMALALPDLATTVANRKLRESFRALSRDEMESYWFGLPLSRLEKEVQIEGLEVLRDALAKGRGVIFYTGHLGSTGLLITVLGKKGIQLNLVFRAIDSVPDMPGAWYRYGRKRISALQAAAGQPILHAGRTNYFTMRRKLRGGEILLMGIDVLPRFLGRTVPVRIFGQWAAFPDGLARLYLDTRAEIVFWCIRRARNGIHQAQLRNVTESVSRLTDITEITQTLVAILEDRIRRYPESWLQWEAFHEYLTPPKEQPPAVSGGRIR